jgi:hypothetical protein
MAQRILPRNPCANLGSRSRVFVTISDVRTCSFASVVRTASSADRSSATCSIPVVGGKFGACLTIVQMR